ncbi:MAG: C1 family peptidase [Armatimonas sp.]
MSIFDVDLRPAIDTMVMPLRAQGSRGTCSVFTITFCIEFTLRQRRLVSEPLSVEYLNWVKNQNHPAPQDGDFFDRIAEGYERFGMLSEAALPYAQSYSPEMPISPELVAQAEGFPRMNGRFIKPWSVTEIVTEEQIAAIKDHLQNGLPVAAGLRWPVKGRGLDTVISGHMAMNWIPAEDVFDGHSIALVGYSEAAGLWVFANWAGPDWGDHGFGYMTDAYLRAYLNDAYVFE